MVARNEEIVGTFTVHLTDYIMNTKLSLYEKLALLEAYLKISRHNGNTQKASHVKSIMERLQKSIKTSNGDLNLAFSSAKV